MKRDTLDKLRGYSRNLTYSSLFQNSLILDLYFHTCGKKRFDNVISSLHDKPHGRYSQYGLRFPYVKYWNLSPVATGSRRTCTDQLTGIHLSSSESFLSGDTWNDMVKHQICTRVDDWPSAINCARCSSPSMHLSDPGGVRNSVSQRWRPV